MKVVFGNSIFGYLLYGGAEVQLEQTRFHLIKLGINVELFNQWDKDILKNVDVLHWFHIDANSFEIIRLAKKRGIKIVVSSIFWPLTNEYLQAIWSRFLSLLYRLKIPFTTYTALQKEVLYLADAVVVSSDSEGAKISKIFGVSERKIYTVPVGVSQSFINASPDIFVEKYHLKDFILCVGRVEPRKNQLNLLRATKDFDIPVVIIGDCTVNSVYYEKCLNIRHSNVYFLGKINYDDELLKSAYAAARVLVMPSTLETPGLVALESALVGTRIVITKYGNTYEYFENYVEYVEPYSVRSIREGILKAMNIPDMKVEELRNKVMNNYTWEKIAEKMYNLYQELIGRI